MSSKTSEAKRGADIEPDAQYLVTLNRMLMIGKLRMSPKSPRNTLRGQVLLENIDAVDDYRKIETEAQSDDVGNNA